MKTDQPIACTLTPEQLQSRRQELLPGLLQGADKMTDITDGIRLSFSHRAGLLTHLSRVIEQEQDCCSFLRFRLSVEPHAGAVTFEITGPPGTAEMLRSL